MTDNSAPASLDHLFREATAKLQARDDRSADHRLRSITGLALAFRHLCLDAIEEAAE